MNEKTQTIYDPSQVESRWKLGPWLGLIVLLVAAGVLLLWRPVTGTLYFSPEVTGAPKLKVDRTLDDAGYVKYGTPVQAAFRLYNAGDEPLQIQGEPQVELIKGCCPPYALIETMTLGPGEETSVTMDYSMYEGMGGPHEFHVRVRSNDPTEPELVLVAKSDWGP